MRNRFIKKLTEAAVKNDKIVLIVGDLGYNVVEEFQNKFPDRFYNAGISEQNMASMAAGLASEGFHVFIYSIANFPTFRCAEQIRNDISYLNLPVTIVTVGGGLSYGSLGYSHHAIQDIGLIRLFPEMKLLTPGDPNQVELCLNYILENPQPSYLRLKKNGENNFDELITNIEDGEWICVKKGSSNKTFLTVSGGLKYAMKAIESEKYENYSVHCMPVWSMTSKTKQDSQANSFEEIVTIEDHLLDGGFGSWLLEATNENNRQKIHIKALSQEIIGKVGDEEFLNKIGGIQI